MTQHFVKKSVIAALFMCATGAYAQEQAGAPAQGDAPAAGVPHATAENTILPDEMTPQLNTTISRGLDALAGMQREDGAFGGNRFGSNAGITALACLAFMGDGNIPGRGEYARNVERGLDFILNVTNETGLVAADTSHGPMYGHGFATLFLGEVYGMTAGGGDTSQSRRVHDALVRACHLIVQTQNDEGGWRYNPVPHDADISVTICQIMALRSARNAGIDIPKGTIDRAVDYVRRSQNADGGFRYQLNRGPSAWPRSAAGIASLYYAGVYEDEALDRGLDYLMRQALPGRTPVGQTHYFYGHYYAVQAMYLAGGQLWATWWPAVREELISRQRENGLWEDPANGSAYGTASALIILQMPKRYLPIFQK